MSKRSSVCGTLGGLAVASAAGFAAYVFAIRPWHRRWGATDAEVSGSMPGDDLVEGANFQTTRAIDIDAPLEAVWPWLAQIGQGRGGFYSYDLLENLMGLDIHSADRILPEFQDLRVGDVIPIEPDVAAETGDEGLVEARGGSSLLRDDRRRMRCKRMKALGPLCRCLKCS